MRRLPNNSSQQVHDHGSPSTLIRYCVHLFPKRRCVEVESQRGDIAIALQLRQFGEVVSVNAGSVDVVNGVSKGLEGGAEMGR
jgi:hypothetical protein